MLEVTLPQELAFDSDSHFYCNALTNITPKSLPCEQSNLRKAVVILTEEALGTLVVKNGTTIIVDLGFIKNPTSLKPTSSFAFETYI